MDKSKVLQRVTKLVPIIHWFPRYKPEWLRYDILAAIVIIGLIIPESMGIAGVAGVPPQYGLYSILIALFLYAIFGSGKHSVVSTPSAMAILTATAVAGIVMATNEDAVNVILSVTIMVGVLLLVAAILRLGFLADFISYPVMKGFLFGLALTIIIGQIPKLLGVEKGTGNFFDQLFYIVNELGNIDTSTLVLASISIVVMVVLEERFKKLPAVLILFVATLFLSYLLDFEGNFGIAVVGTIPQGLPSLSAPQIDMSTLNILIPAAIGIAFVCFSESIAIGEEVGERHKEEVDPNQELVALAATNLGAGVTQGIGNGVSMSASMVGDNSGLRSQMALLFAGLMVMIVLLFLTGVFYYIPEAVLGVIVIFAVRGALKFKLLAKFYHTQRSEFHLALVALFGVLVFEVLVGLVLAVIVAIALMVWRASRVGGVLMGRMPSGEFRRMTAQSGCQGDTGPEDLPDRWQPLLCQQLGGEETVEVLGGDPTQTQDDRHSDDRDLPGARFHVQPSLGERHQGGEGGGGGDSDNGRGQIDLGVDAQGGHHRSDRRGPCHPRPDRCAGIL